MSAVNVRAYRATGGRVGGTWRVGAAWRKPAPICLLEHVGRRTGRVRARTADPEERAALWSRLLEVYADFAAYQSWTDREIPVVVLEPR